VQALIGALERIDLGAPPPPFAAMLRDALATEVVVRFSLDLDRTVPTLVDRECVGVSSAMLDVIARGFRRGALAALFDFAYPQPVQRDRILSLGTARDVLASHSRRLATYGHSARTFAEIRVRLESLVRILARYGCDVMHHHRVIVCDGPQLLAYVNVMHAKRLTKRQLHVFNRVVASLRRRVVAQQLLATWGTNAATLRHVLDANARPLFVVSGGGRIIENNEAAARELLRSPRLGERVIDATRSDDSELDVVEIRHTGEPARFLVRMTQFGRPRSLAAELGVSPRAAEILALLASGLTNKEIAARAGIAINTVEYHLTRVFARAGVKTRRELLALLVDRR
jgi:DNA-binding CsgD family transcriptional regulator